MTIKVNDIEIADEAVRYELSRLLEFYSQHMAPEHLEAQMGVLTAQAKDQAIGTQLLIQEVQRADIPIDEKAVEEAFDEMVTAAGGKDVFDEVLEKQKLSIDAVRMSIVHGKQIDTLIEKITEDIPEPTEEEIHTYFKEHEQDYSKPERTMAQHILIKPNTTSDEDVATARQKLVDIRKEYEDGGDFEKLAEEHSECPSGKQAGGSLGWVTRGMMVSEFEEALFGTEVGEVSEIVKTQFGLHIALRTEHAEAETATFDDTKDQVRDLINHNRRGRKVSEFVEALKATATIEDDEPPPEAPVAN